ncbi:MAG: hypothetical protein WA885_20720 [Phormidesmis sp.]
MRSSTPSASFNPSGAAVSKGNNPSDPSKDFGQKTYTQSDRADRNVMCLVYPDGSTTTVVPESDQS